MLIRYPWSSSSSWSQTIFGRHLIYRHLVNSWRSVGPTHINQTKISRLLTKVSIEYIDRGYRSTLDIGWLKQTITNAGVAKTQTPPERSDIFIFSGLLLSRWSNNKKLPRFKIAADTLMTFPGKFFYRRNRRHRFVAIMFKLKSVLYPPDATAINRRST